MSFVFTLLSVALALGALHVYGWRKKSRLSAATWEQLVGQLEAVPMIGITKVALAYLQPKKGQLAIQTDELKNALSWESECAGKLSPFVRLLARFSAV